MIELPTGAVRIAGGFWGQRLTVNAGAALEHQWRQLERSLCIDNFRLAAGLKVGFREGFFFADSDAYKWLDAASRSLGLQPDPALEERVETFIDILEQAQQPDGYLNTYNQLHFKGQRWVNLQIEHEFYCLGHLIEAGIAHYQATGGSRLLDLARRAADLLGKTFSHAGPASTDGHEEIEIALIRLSRLTTEPAYLDLARRFIERRGRIRGYPVLFLAQSLSTARRMKARDRQRALYLRAHPEHQVPRLPTRFLRKVPPAMPLRVVHNLLSGKYAQQNTPVRQQTVPVGHAVRFTYLETAAAMLARQDADTDLLAVLEQAWEHMVSRRMYASGGIGSLPITEGFGRDYELHPEIAYAETCAALGCLLWNWEMTLVTGKARYADLFEWQLYNAASVSMALDGCSYFYDNPLASRGGLVRHEWYDVPCCPSNLSRVWAGLPGMIYSQQDDHLWLHQFITSRAALSNGMTFRTESGLPWDGSLKLTVDQGIEQEVELLVRIPSWVGKTTLRINDNLVEMLLPESRPDFQTACGYNPTLAFYQPIRRRWQSGDALEIDFELPILRLRQDQRLPVCGGKVALARGPLLYCLESIDNPGIDLFSADLRPDSCRAIWEPDLLGGITALQAETSTGEPLKFIPYLFWANRGESLMNVFVKQV